MKNSGMSDTAKEAIRNMPVHWETDQQQSDYYKANAEYFITQYKTPKTQVDEKWPDLESARKAAKFAVEVSTKVGRLPRGVSIYAALGGHGALIETHYSHKDAKTTGLIKL